MPLLLLNSLGDRMVAPSCTTEIAALWTVPCLTHPWAGHDLPLNHPAWVIAAVREWMAANIDRPHAA
ncbi:alpha/beta fold hydrolase [Methylogaea oryzae]|uniref:alpha/beta fold hydrolase n=1 Tax=Methylogaea oryzae TaxID=1295382 RepID=UPI0012E0FE5F|nr:hypothetical protein [Methylogaea oryzae]